jgi:hypothetical protein
MYMKSTTTTTTLLAAATLFAASAITASAAIVSPTSVASSDSGLSNRGSGKIIDGSGLFGSGDILTQTHARSDEDGNDHLFLGSAATVTFDFDLPSATDLDQVHLWQYVNPGGSTGYRQVDFATFTFSSDGGTTYSTDDVRVDFSTILSAVGSQSVPVQTSNFFLNDGDGNYDIDYTASNVTNIKMVATATSTSDRLGLAEIRFNAVPEPSAALFGGFALLTLALRRRR